MIGIYKIENLINGKKYIGQSVNILERWGDHKRINERPLEKVKQTYPLYRAFKKYGLENFSFEVIEECSKEELDSRERYWIANYHTYIKDPQGPGYNLTLGGGGIQTTTNEEIQNFIELWNQGLSVGEISLIVERNNHCIINYLKEFCPTYTVEEGSRRGSALSGLKHTKSVIQCDLLGNIIKKYDSIKEAEFETSINRTIIINNAKHKTTTCHGYFFFYANDDLEEALKIQYSLPKFETPVIQFDENDNVIACFKSAKIAAKSFKKATGQAISSCCKKETKSAYGYKWKFLEYEDIDKYKLREIGIKGEDDILKCYFCEEKERKFAEVFYSYSCSNEQKSPEYFNLYYCPVCGKKILDRKNII